MPGPVPVATVVDGEVVVPLGGIAVVIIVVDVLVMDVIEALDVIDAMDVMDVVSVSGRHWE